MAAPRHGDMLAIPGLVVRAADGSAADRDTVKPRARVEKSAREAGTRVVEGMLKKPD